MRCELDTTDGGVCLTPITRDDPAACPNRANHTRLTWHTDNGVEITPGLRVFTNDWEWGIVLPEQFEPGGRVHRDYFDGWFEVKRDSGRTTIYNGERMTTVKPR